MVMKVGFEPTPFQSARFTVWCSSAITAASPISIELSVFNVGQLYRHDFHLGFLFLMWSVPTATTFIYVLIYPQNIMCIIQEKIINAIG